MSEEWAAVYIEEGKGPQGDRTDIRIIGDIKSDRERFDASVKPSTPRQRAQDNAEYAVHEAAHRQLEELMRLEDIGVRNKEMRKYFERGLAEGEAKGEAKGEARGEAKGRAKGQAKALLRVLAARGLEVTESHRDQIQRLHTVKRIMLTLGHFLEYRIVGLAGQQAWCRCYPGELMDSVAQSHR